MSGWTLWLILSLDKIPIIASVFVVILLPLVTFFFATVLAEDRFNKNNIIYEMGISFLRKLAVVTLLTILIAIMTPSTREAFIIYGAPKLAKNQHLNETGRKLLTFTELYLNVKTKELGKEKRK